MFDPAFTFERFVVGATNELAVRAARAVAEAPGSVYSPLVVHGDAGVGKTHLLNALGLHAVALDPELSVVCEDAERLAEMVTRALAGGDLTPLQDALGGVDLLMIDGVERLAGMERTQQELAIVAGRLIGEGRQVVLAALGSPADLSAFDPALRDVLEHALAVEIEPSDRELRHAIARQRAAELNLSLGEEIFDALADSSAREIRDILIAIERLAERIRATGNLPEPDDLYAVLGDDAAAPAGDEFSSFMDDVKNSLSVAVEAAPWRRRIVEALLRWEGEGIRTTRLDEALQADTPPNVDSLLEGFSRDATRLLEIRRELGDDPRAALLDDPDDLQGAESLRVRLMADSSRRARRGPPNPPEPPRAEIPPDPWFLDPVRSGLSWTGADDRLVEDPR